MCGLRQEAVRGVEQPVKCSTGPLLGGCAEVGVRIFGYNELPASPLGY